MANFIIKGANTSIMATGSDYLLKKRIVKIEGEINRRSAAETVDQLLILAFGSKQPITILINSDGGSISAGLSIIDAMKMTGVPVTCVCTETAASMGAVIFSQGDRRLMFPHSTLLLHQARITGNISGDSEYMRQISKQLADDNKEIIKLLAEKTGNTAAKVTKATSFDNIMTPSEAIEFGIADGIVEDLNMIMEVQNNE